MAGWMQVTTSEFLRRMIKQSEKQTELLERIAGSLDRLSAIMAAATAEPVTYEVGDRKNGYELTVDGWKLLAERR